MNLATVDPDTRNTADSGTTVNDRFNELASDGVLRRVRHFNLVQKVGMFAAAALAVRKVVVVGWDGRSNPMLRYADEMHLPDYARSLVVR